jgi:hypothetical protein
VVGTMLPAESRVPREVQYGLVVFDVGLGDQGGEDNPTLTAVDQVVDPCSPSR